MESNAAQTELNTMDIACGKCDGKGTLSWTRVANGTCFVCQGVGKLTVERTRKQHVRMELTGFCHIFFKEDTCQPLEDHEIARNESYYRSYATRMAKYFKLYAHHDRADAIKIYLGLPKSVQTMISETLKPA